MRILIATDAWHPQVNGVVRTLTSWPAAPRRWAPRSSFLTPDGFPSMALPTYPGLRVAWPNRREIARRIEAASPDAIHIATEGPIGWAVRAYCRRRKLAFTTSYTTRFPEYIAVRSIIPAWLQLCGAAAFSCGRRHDHGRDRLAAAGTRRARLQQARLLDARRRHRAVHARRACRARFAAADLHDRRPRRGRKESRGVSVAGPAGNQGGDRRRTAAGAACSAAIRRSDSSAKRRAGS